MKRFSLKSIPAAITVAVLLVVGAADWLSNRSGHLEFLNRFEWITYDWRVRNAFEAQQPISTNLAAIFVDDDSFNTINTNYGFGWPWPRAFHGRLVEELSKQGVAGVGFDIFFIETNAPSEDTSLELGGRIYTSDEWFARAIGLSSNVFLGVPGETKNDRWAAVAPHAMFRSRAAGLGLAVSDRDADGVLRRTKPFRDDPELGRIWHLGIVMAARVLKLDLDQAVIRTDRIELSGPGGIRRVIPTDEDGFFDIDWSIAWNDPRMTKGSYEEILNMEDDRVEGNGTAGHRLDGKLAGKLVIVGSIAAGNNVSDVGASPLRKEDYLVSKHWNVANSVLTGRFIVRTPPALRLLLITLLGAAAAVITWKVRAPLPTVLVLSLSVGYVMLAQWLYTRHRIWIPITTPVVGALLMTHVAAVTYQALFEQSEKRRVKGVFSKVVSPDVVNELLGSDKLNLDGARRHITVFFADVRGFTTLTDQNQSQAEEYVRANKLTGEDAERHYDKSARETLETVNLYLATIADQIKKHKGTLDKYIGDCVMAFWGAPIANPQHAVSCVRASIDAQRAMDAVNQERGRENVRREAENKLRAERGEPPLPMLGQLALGTGINTGTVIVGLMGSTSHILNYTVFGREVNIASRLEGVSGRGRIIIGEATYEDIRRDDPELAATCVELEPVTVKGINKPVRIFEVPWKLASPPPQPA